MMEKLNELTISLKEDLSNLYPSIITALVVVLFGYIVSRIVKYLVIKLVIYIGKLAGQNNQYMNLDQTAKFIGAVCFWIIFLTAFIFAADILGLSIVSNWMEEILKFSPNLLAAILIISTAIIFGKFTSRAILSFGNHIGLEHAKTLGKIAQYMILFTAIIIAIDQIGFEVKFLIDIIDIIIASMLFATALAFGLGARTSVSNILAAFYVRKRYKVGDRVIIGEIEGIIIKIDVTMVVVENESSQFSIPAKDFNEKTSGLLKKK